MTFKHIKPIMAGSQAHTLKKPSLYRACVNGDPTEYAVVEAKIMMLYLKANWKDEKDE